MEISLICVAVIIFSWLEFLVSPTVIYAFDIEFKSWIPYAAGSFFNAFLTAIFMMLIVHFVGV